MPCTCEKTEWVAFAGIACVGLLPSLLVGCDDSVICGQGMSYQAGACVPATVDSGLRDGSAQEQDASDNVRCGPGTVNEDGWCIRDPRAFVDAAAIDDSGTGIDAPTDSEMTDSGGRVEDVEGSVQPTDGAEPSLRCGTGTVAVDGACVVSPESRVVCGVGTVLRAGACVPGGPVNISGLTVTHFALRRRGSVLDGTVGASTITEDYPVDVSIGISYTGDRASVPVALALLPPDDTSQPCLLGGLEIAHPGGTSPVEAVATVTIQIPHGCLVRGETQRTMVPAVIIDPDRQMNLQPSVNRLVLFSPSNTADADLAVCRRDRERSHEAGAGKNNCQLAVTIERSPGLDFELAELKAESSVLVVDQCGSTPPRLLNGDEWSALLSDPTSVDALRPKSYRCNGNIVPEFEIKTKAGSDGSPVPDLDPFGNVQYALTDGIPQIARVVVNGQSYPSFVYGDADLSFNATVVTHGEPSSDATSFDDAKQLIENGDPIAHNALSGRELEFRYDIRPTDSANDADWRPLYLHNRADQANGTQSGQTRATEPISVAIPSAPSHYLHGLYLENDCTEASAATCNPNLNTRDDIIYWQWSRNLDFSVRGCVIPKKDGAYDATVDHFPDNNCKIINVRLARRRVPPESQATASRCFDFDWKRGIGNASSARLDADLSSHNQLDTAGATADNQSRMGLSSDPFGNTDLMRAWARAAGYVALDGSYYDYGLEVFGEKIWGEKGEATEVHWDKDFKISKETRRDVMVWAGPLPLWMGYRIAGEVGQVVSLDVIAVDSKVPDDPDEQQLASQFVGASRIGRASASATPYGVMKATLSTGVNWPITHMGVAGELTVLDLRARLMGDLAWGVRSQDPPQSRGSAWADFRLTLTAMKGRLYGCAEHSPFDWEWSQSRFEWPRFWDRTVADWFGATWNQTMWASPPSSFNVERRPATTRADFWNTDGDRRPAEDRVDWSAGNAKGTCASNEAAVGLSAYTANGSAHGILCATFETLQSTQTAVLTAADENRRASRMAAGSTSTDWDDGYRKLECGIGEFVSGLSQERLDQARIQALRCSSGFGSGMSCERRVLDNSAGLSGIFGDWDYGYYKADCPDLKVVVGVSVRPTDGRLRSILCCER